MTALSCPIPGETLAEAAVRIRAVWPIHGSRETDEDCRVRDELCSETLLARGVEVGERHWYTAQLVTGRVVGIWANAVEEAELNLSIWNAADCAWVRVDDGCRIHRTYCPQGKRSTLEADRIFPVGPPRTPPDHFARASSLLDALDLQVPVVAEGVRR